MPSANEFKDDPVRFVCAYVNARNKAMAANTARERSMDDLVSRWLIAELDAMERRLLLKLYVLMIATAGSALVLDRILP